MCGVFGDVARYEARALHAGLRLQGFGWGKGTLRVDGWLTRRRVERAARVVATRVLRRGRSSDQQHSERGKHGTVHLFECGGWVFVSPAVCCGHDAM